MKTIDKAIIIGIITFFVVIYLNLVLSKSVLSILIPGGDDFMNSYHVPIYSGISVAISVMVGSTYLIVKKLNEILIKLNKTESN